MATAYGPPWGGIQGTGTTASGVDLHSSPHIYGVAVDPSVIPLGTKLVIEPNPFNYQGTFEAFDTGGAILGNRIDFYDWRGRSSQLGWGFKAVQVWKA
jgi:3D (Asp-Asp-Asp) domain-containing protein